MSDPDTHPMVPVALAGACLDPNAAPYPASRGLPPVERRTTMPSAYTLPLTPRERLIADRNSSLRTGGRGTPKTYHQPARVGDRIGAVEVLALLGVDQHGHARVRFRCACGRVADRMVFTLRAKTECWHVMAPT